MKFTKLAEGTLINFLNILHIRFCINSNSLSCVVRKPTFWYLTWSDTNQAVQVKKMARSLKFRI